MIKKGDCGYGVAVEDSCDVVEKQAAAWSCRVRADSHLTSSLTSQVWWYETLIPEVEEGHSWWQPWLHEI